MRRRQFLLQTATGLLVLKAGKLIAAADSYNKLVAAKPVLRFIVASDGHYGLKDTEYEIPKAA